MSYYAQKVADVLVKLEQAQNDRANTLNPETDGDRIGFALLAVGYGLLAVAEKLEAVNRAMDRARAEGRQR